MLSRKQKLLSAIGFAALTSVGVRTASAADLKCEPKEIATKYPGIAGKTVRIAQDGEDPPYSFRDPKDFQQFVGLDVDLARAVFACAGAKVEFFTGAWSGLLPAVIAGQADVMWELLALHP